VQEGSKRYRVTTEVFARMVAESVDGVWQGSLTGIIDASDGRNYYSDVKQALIASGAAEQITRGGGTALSEWRILNPDVDFRTVGTIRAGHEGRRIDAIERLLGGLDVKQALAAMATDIQNLKLDVARLKQAEAKRDA
jgi:hypothetical protein